MYAECNWWTTCSKACRSLAVLHRFSQHLFVYLRMLGCKVIHIITRQTWSSWCNNQISSSVIGDFFAIVILSIDFAVCCTADSLAGNFSLKKDMRLKQWKSLLQRKYVTVRQIHGDFSALNWFCVLFYVLGRFSCYNETQMWTDKTH